MTPHKNCSYCGIMCYPCPRSMCYLCARSVPTLALSRDREVGVIIDTIPVENRPSCPKFIRKIDKLVSIVKNPVWVDG